MNILNTNIKKLLLSQTAFMLSIFCFTGMAEVRANTVLGDSLLTLDEAIAIALEQNHNVLIARNNQQIAQNADNIGNAGLLPDLNAVAGYQYSNNNTTLELAPSQPGQPGNVISQDGAVSTTKNAALNATYTLFDGFSSFQVKKQLAVDSDLASLQFQQQMEQTVALISQAYTQSYIASRNLALAEEAIKRSTLRLNRAKDNFELGLVNRIEVLSAEVDLNTDKLALEDAKNAKSAADRILALEMGIENPTTSFSVQSPNEPSLNLAMEELLSEAVERNSLLQANRLQKENAAISYSIATRAFSPRLQANGSYNWSRTENDASILVFQENTGFSGGLNLSVGLFNGNRRSIQRQNAKLILANAELSLDRSKKDTERALLNAFDTYQTSLKQIELQRQSVETAELNFQRAQELFNAGQLNAVQIRDVQLSLQQAELNLSNLQMQAFLAHTEILRLTGRLLKNG